jgi:hypothetical protein
MSASVCVQRGGFMLRACALFVCVSVHECDCLCVCVQVECTSLSLRI